MGLRWIQCLVAHFAGQRRRVSRAAQNYVKCFELSSSAMALVRANEISWRGRAVMASCSAVANVYVRTQRNNTHSFLNRKHLYIETHEPSCCCCPCSLYLDNAGFTVRCSLLLPALWGLLLAALAAASGPCSWPIYAASCFCWSLLDRFPVDCGWLPPVRCCWLLLRKLMLPASTSLEAAAGLCWLQLLAYAGCSC